MEAYVSQQDVIERTARERRISKSELDSYFERKIGEVFFMFPDQPLDWRLYRAELLIWEHFFRGEKFPGKLPKRSAISESKSTNEGRQSQMDKHHPPPRQIHTKDRPWVHDMFEPGSTPTREGLRAEKGDYYRPALAPTLRANDRNRKENISPPTNINNVTFLSQDSLMGQKASAKGITGRDYKNTCDRFNKEVKLRHSSKHVNPQWLLWKEQSMVWAHFFKSEPFPGQEPVMAMNSQASTSSGTMTTIEGYTSCWRSIEGKAMMMGITLMEINGFHKEMQKVAELRFRRESPYWRRWFAEASVWARFFRDSNFPGREPHRLYASPSAVTTALGAQSSLGNSGGTSPAPASLNTQPTTVHSTAASLSTTYKIQEQIMERKARALDIRHEFFRYLQRSRDAVRKEHRDCTRDARNYLADLMTWEHFFSPEAFPGIKPFGGHHITCINRTLKASLPSREHGASVPAQATRSEQDLQPGTSTNPSNVSTKVAQHLQPVSRTSSTLTGPTRLPQPLPLQLRAPATSNVPVDVEQARLYLPAVFIELAYAKGHSGLSAGTITNQNTEIRITDRGMILDMLTTFERDDAKAKSDVEYILNSCLRCRERPSGDLLLTIEPFKVGDDAAYKAALRFLLGWVRSCARDKMITLSEYARSFEEAGLGDPNYLNVEAVCAPTTLLVNGKNVPLNPADFKTLSRAFSKDREKRELVEKALDCRFILVGVKEETSLKYLVATGPNPAGERELPAARYYLPGIELWHPANGSKGSEFLEAWVTTVRCAGENMAPSIAAFWEEYSNNACESAGTPEDRDGLYRREALKRTSGLEVNNGGTQLELCAAASHAAGVDRMIVEEAVKAGGMLGKALVNLGHPEGRPVEVAGEAMAVNSASLGNMSLYLRHSEEVATGRKRKAEDDVVEEGEDGEKARGEKRTKV